MIHLAAHHHAPRVDLDVWPPTSDMTDAELHRSPRPKRCEVCEAICWNRHCDECGARFCRIPVEEF